MKTLDEKALGLPLKDALRKAGRAGVVIKRKGKQDYALMPVSDSLLDYMLEHSPQFIKECAEIRNRMETGEVHRLEDVIAELGIDIGEKTPGRTGKSRAVKRVSPRS